MLIFKMRLKKEREASIAIEDLEGKLYVGQLVPRFCFSFHVSELHSVFCVHLVPHR